MGKQQDERAARLAEALRENLRRRKAQAREGQGDGAPVDARESASTDAGDSSES
ncbi:hypothetical protein [Sphingomonas colocasiae]|uniref:DUF4169 family protein n=1 Tax=Sphingomonas colocasiae TaxID=1848973 RepID=A0ABS7PR78_9SPHN|nr:hypothetical protein [Sphingomonas colocasiae]MBY8823728.1 hypothetical protein [Sphingomonas colocasiae]